MENVPAAASPTGSKNQTGSSLRAIAKGSLLTFIGTGASAVLLFITNSLLARGLGREMYGQYSLVLATIEIAVLISALGLGTGVARYIPFLREHGKTADLRRVIRAALFGTLVAGCLVAIGVIILAPWLADSFFHDPELRLALTVTAIGIPLFALLELLASILRGFGDVRARVYFQDFLFHGLVGVSVVAVLVFQLQLAETLLSRVVAALISVGALAVYVRQKLPALLPDSLVPPTSASIFRALIFFSIPLLGTSLLSVLLVRSDTILLGYFLDASDVGLYNGAAPIARILQFIQSSIGYIFLPVITGLYARRQTEELRRSFIVITKWTFFVTFPIFLTIFLFPAQTLTLFFGDEFLAGASVLRVLLLGTLFDVTVGLNSILLISLGKQKTVLAATSIAVIGNLGLNLLLIPPFGIVGSAIATATAIVLTNIYNSVRLYQFIRLHPFTPVFFKILIAALIATIVLLFGLTPFVSERMWGILPAFFGLLLIASYGLIRAWKLAEPEDIEILRAIERRFTQRSRLVDRLFPNVRVDSTPTTTQPKT